MIALFAIFYVGKWPECLKNGSEGLAATAGEGRWGLFFLFFQAFFVGKNKLKFNCKMRKQLTFFALLFDGSGAFNLIVDFFAG